MSELHEFINTLCEHDLCSLTERIQIIVILDEDVEVVGGVWSQASNRFELIFCQERNVRIATL